MWDPQLSLGDKVSPMARLVAVAIDADKGSQTAVTWAVDNLLIKGQAAILVHVKLKQFLTEGPAILFPTPMMKMEKNCFQGIHCFCTRKDIQCYDVVLDDRDVTKAIIEFVKHSAIDVLVLGATAKGSIVRPENRGSSEAFERPYKIILSGSIETWKLERI